MSGQGRDPLGVALAGVVIGGATGGAIVCLVLTALHDATRGSPVYLNLLFLGGAGGLIAAAAVAWTVGRQVGNPFRRAMVAMVAVAGAAFVGALTVVADAAAGRAGLLGLTAACLAALGLAYRLLLAR